MMFPDDPLELPAGGSPADPEYPLEPVPAPVP